MQRRPSANSCPRRGGQRAGTSPAPPPRPAPSTGPRKSARAGQGPWSTAAALPPTGSRAREKGPAYVRMAAGPSSTRLSGAAMPRWGQPHPGARRQGLHISPPGECCRTEPWCQAGTCALSVLGAGSSTAPAGAEQCGVADRALNTRPGQVSLDDEGFEDVAHDLRAGLAPGGCASASSAWTLATERGSWWVASARTSSRSGGCAPASAASSWGFPNVATAESEVPTGLLRIRILTRAWPTHRRSG